MILATFRCSINLMAVFLFAWNDPNTTATWKDIEAGIDGLWMEDQRILFLFFPVIHGVSDCFFSVFVEFVPAGNGEHRSRSALAGYRYQATAATPSGAANRQAHVDSWCPKGSWSQKRRIVVGWASRIMRLSLVYEKIHIVFLTGNFSSLILAHCGSESAAFLVRSFGGRNGWEDYMTECYRWVYTYIYNINYNIDIYIYLFICVWANLIMTSLFSRTLESCFLKRNHTLLWPQVSDWWIIIICSDI